MTRRLRLLVLEGMYLTLLTLSIILGSCCSQDTALNEPNVNNSSKNLNISAHSSRNRRSIEALESLIPSNYSIHEPPPTNNGEATAVDFSVLIMNVRDIKELNEELSLEMNLRIYWKDTRLSHLSDRSAGKYVVLNPRLVEHIWVPDIFIDHVKSVSQPALIAKPASLRVYPDSGVRYSARITVTMACQMDFHYYPADTQRCSVDMKSYAYSSSTLSLDLREGKGALLVEYLDLPNFDVSLDNTQNFMVNTSSASYSGIRFTVVLRRKLSYHLIQTYLPSSLFIMVSWLSFLVPPESVPGRMALCMTTLLTLTAMFSAVRQNTPNVSYVKALDIWMVVCIIFVFLTLVEYTVLLKLRSKKSKPTPKISRTMMAAALAQNGSHSKLGFKSIAEVSRPKDTDNKNSEILNGVTNRKKNENVRTAEQVFVPKPIPETISNESGLNKFELAAKIIEKFTSKTIPSLFILFNFIYWPWLIQSANYFD